MRFLPLVLWPLLAAAAPACAQTILVSPYVQPGNGTSLSGTDTKVVAWVTDQKPADYVLEYSIGDQAPVVAKPSRTKLDFGLPTPPPPAKAATPKPAPAAATEAANPLANAATNLEDLKTAVAKESAVVTPEKLQHYFTYRATLEKLPFDTAVHYRLKLGEQTVREGTFQTRASAGKSIHFVAVGDLANGKPDEMAIAWQIAQQKPEFMIALGDIVYPQGRVSQYLHHFWPVYVDVPQPGPKTGAPIFNSTTLYPVIGNHDADMAKLPAYPDAFGAYYFFSVPRNGPGLGPWNLPLGKDGAVAAAFRKTVGTAYPSLNIYSWDYGCAHFVALDSNSYTKVDDPAFLAWLEMDLSSSKQPWKFVCFHAPAFHTSREHYTEQKMRLLEPIFEKTGVDVVFAGHVHNYQRSKPLRFTPAGGRDARGRVNGELLLDEQYDGIKNTAPNGIIHIVTGGGGATLYKIDLQKTMEGLKKDHGENYVPLTAKWVSDQHSLSVIDLSPEKFTLRQIGQTGEEVDRFTITKK